MNLNSRLSKLETGQGLSTVSMVIVAEDQADFDRQFEDAFLAVLGPCRLSVSGKIAGVPFSGKDLDILAFEDYLGPLA
jgi:hypothetical protein